MKRGFRNPSFTYRSILSAFFLLLPALTPPLLHAGNPPAEWLAFQLGGGPYIGVVRLDLATLRRGSLYWTLFHMRANGFVDTGYLEFGNAIGAVLSLSAKTEFRAGLGMAYSRYVDGRQFWHGFGITPQVSLTWGKRRHFMWECTAAVHVPLAGKHGTDPGFESLLANPNDTPPVFTLCIGFRI